MCLEQMSVYVRCFNLQMILQKSGYLTNNARHSGAHAEVGQNAWKGLFEMHRWKRLPGKGHMAAE